MALVILDLQWKKESDVTDVAYPPCITRSTYCRYLNAQTIRLDIALILRQEGPAWPSSHWSLWAQQLGPWSEPPSIQGPPHYRLAPQAWPVEWISSFQRSKGPILNLSFEGWARQALWEGSGPSTLTLNVWLDPWSRRRLSQRLRTKSIYSTQIGPFKSSKGGCFFSASTISKTAWPSALVRLILNGRYEKRNQNWSCARWPLQLDRPAISISFLLLHDKLLQT